MKRFSILASILSLLTVVARGQTTHGRIVTDSYSNAQTIVITGATPDVSKGNVFKTNNGGPTTITNFLNGVDTQQITVECGDTNTTIASNLNIVIGTGSNFTCVLNQTMSFVFVSATGKWIQQASSVSGGGTPAAPVNCVQKNASGFFGCSNLTDNGTTLSVSEDATFKGPNPRIYITSYGGRAVTVVPTTTATITSGSANATLTSASTFQNGDGIVFDGAGATVTLSTPGSPTVTPSAMAGSVGTKAVVATSAGATSWQYQVVAVDKAGGRTAAGPVGTTTTGLATLGNVTVNITSTARANNVVTFTMSAPEDLVVGEAILVQGMSDITFNGSYNVQTVIDNQHFTAIDYLKDTRNGASLSATGGFISYVNCNYVTWSAVPGTWIYAIYGRTSGSMVFLGFSRPFETYFEDYGAGTPNLMGAPFRPRWIPSAPPGAAQNDELSTTIVSGGGTTSVTLATTAVNSTTATNFVFDDVPALTAALNAGGTAIVVLPYDSAGGSWVFNSFLFYSAANVKNIEQAGPAVINETFEIDNGINWAGVGGSVFTSGDRGIRPRLTCNAVPCFYDNGIGGRVNNVFVGSSNDQSLFFLEDGPFPASKYVDLTWSTGSGGNKDYLSVGYEGRGGAKAEFKHINCEASVTNGGSGTNGYWAPCIHLRGDLANANPNGNIDIEEFYTFSRSMLAIETTVGISAVNGSAHNVYTNGGISPVITYQSDVGCCLSGHWTLDMVDFDTTFVSAWANLLGGSAANLTVSNIGGNTQNVVSGSTPINVTVRGQVAGSTMSANVTFPDAGIVTTSLPFGVYTGTVAGASGAGTLNHLISTAAVAPTASGPTAGGSVPLGAHTYKIQYLDVNGNTMPLSPASNSITATGGNQTITISPNSPPAGVVSYYLTRDGGVRLGCSATPIGTSFVDTQASACGNSIFVSGAGDQTVGINGISGTSFAHVNNGFTNYSSLPNPLTVNRNIFWPDATGYVPVTSYLNSFYDTFNRANGGLGANWTTYQNGVGTFIPPVISGNQSSVGTSASRNAWAFLATNTFSTDQFSQFTIVGDVASANTAYYAVVKLKNTGPGGSQGYYCGIGGTNAVIGKITGTSTSNLTSTSVSAAAVNDVIRCDYIFAGGTGNLSMTRNGSVILSTTDSSITTGAPGFGMVNNGAIAAIDNWSGGNEHPLTHLDLEQDWNATQHFRLPIDFSSVVGTSPVSNLNAAPTTYNHSGTQAVTPHVVSDSSSFTTGTVTVTFTGSAVFTSSASYSCTATDTTASNSISVTYTSGSSVTFNGTGTDTFRYLCVGN